MNKGTVDQTSTSGTEIVEYANGTRIAFHEDEDQSVSFVLFEYHTASFIVTKLNDDRSLSLVLFAGDKVKPAGNVTLPPGHPVPPPGSVVDCRYLYAFKETGCIHQPVFLGVRRDLRAADCTTAQLKYKAEILQEAA